MKTYNPTRDLGHPVFNRNPDMRDLFFQMRGLDPTVVLDNQDDSDLVGQGFKGELIIFQAMLAKGYEIDPTNVDTQRAAAMGVVPHDRTYEDRLLLDEFQHLSPYLVASRKSPPDFIVDATGQQPMWLECKTGQAKFPGSVTINLGCLLRYTEIDAEQGTKLVIAFYDQASDQIFFTDIQHLRQQAQGIVTNGASSRQTSDHGSDVCFYEPAPTGKGTRLPFFKFAIDERFWFRNPELTAPAVDGSLN